MTTAQIITDSSARHTYYTHKHTAEFCCLCEGQAGKWSLVFLILESTY